MIHIVVTMMEAMYLAFELFTFLSQNPFWILLSKMEQEWVEMQGLIQANQINEKFILTKVEGITFQFIVSYALILYVYFDNHPRGKAMILIQDFVKGYNIISWRLAMNKSRLILLSQ